MGTPRGFGGRCAGDTGRLWGASGALGLGGRWMGDIGGLWGQRALEGLRGYQGDLGGRWMEDMRVSGAPGGFWG